MQRNELVGPSQEISPRQKRTKSERALSEGVRLRRLALYDQVVELYKQGGSILGIARQLQIGHQTVRKFVKTPSFPERSKASRTKSALDPYRPYLEKRWQQGCHATSQLWKEVQAQGFTGSWMMVYRWVQLQEAASGVPGQTSHQANGAPKLVAPRHLAWLLIREPEHLEKQEQQTLSFIRQDKNVDLAYELVQQFVTMVKERSAKPLDTWLLNCQTSGISELDNFAQGLQKEASALQAALTLSYSNDYVA